MDGASVHELRVLARQLLDTSAPADAPTAYYALFHDAARTALYTAEDAQGRVTGFLGVCQTGLDLFRPLVTLHCLDETSAAMLLARALTPQRPYILFARMNQLPLLSAHLDFDNLRALHIYRLNPRHFRPPRNAPVQMRRTPDGAPRWVIASAEGRAVAGLNWRSPAFAEIYVQVDEAVRGRGWGTDVVAAASQDMLSEGRIPLYLVAEGNESSVRLAESLGYMDTGAQQVLADIVLQTP